jgi:hypothetical protein
VAVVDTRKSCTGNDIVTVRVVSLGFSGGDTLSYVQDWCFVFTATSLHYLPAPAEESTGENQFRCNSIGHARGTAHEVHLARARAQGIKVQDPA